MYKFIAGLVCFIFLSAGQVIAQNDLPKITDSELEKFSTVFEDLRKLDKKIQRNMITIVSEENMDIKRFNELYKKDLDPNREVELSGEEMEKFTHIVEEIETMQVNFQKDIEQTIRNSGLSVEKYQQIATRLQIDAELQARLRNSVKD